MTRISTIRALSGALAVLALCANASAETVTVKPVAVPAVKPSWSFGAKTTGGTKGTTTNAVTSGGSGAGKADRASPLFYNKNQ